MQKDQIVEQLATLLLEQGVDINAVAEAVRAKRPQAPQQKPRRTRRRDYQSTVQAARAAPEARQATARAEQPKGRGKGKYTYGTSPVVRYANGSPRPLETHEARCEALDVAMPGFTEVAYVFSVGRDANQKNTKDFACMLNVPWTWVELPEGKAFTIGKLSAGEVRAMLASLGYGWSPANKLWACDGNGGPSRRRFGGECKGVGKALLNDE